MQTATTTAKKRKRDKKTGALCNPEMNLKNLLFISNI